VFALYIGGARDYLLILVGDAGYIRGQFGTDGVTYFADYPLVLRAIWTINILGGLIAPVLLVILNRWALAVAVVAATAQIVLLAVTLAFLDRWAMLGAATSWFDIGVGVATTLFAGYCWVIRRRGLLP
ncbi:MAG: hypothetical protein ACK40Z_11305, partial [Dietzia sp.]